MSDILADLALSADIYAQKLDLVRDAVLLIRLPEREYRRASFLDDRVLTPTTEGAWAPASSVIRESTRAPCQLPLNFIFHSGHVGSTLLSRVLDETGSVLGLREPLPLRTFADAADTLEAPESLVSAEQFRERLNAFLRLWRRGYRDTRTVVVKATSSAARLAPHLLSNAPEARAVYLNLSASRYITTLLAGENAILDLRAHAPERVRRLSRLLGRGLPPLHAMSSGELAAASWLAERLCQEEAIAKFGERVMAVDFDAFLANIAATLQRIVAHLKIEAPTSFTSRAAALPVFTRYSKAPSEHAYSPAMRAEILAQAQKNHAGEIVRGLALLERLASVNIKVADVLSL